MRQQRIHQPFAPALPYSSWNWKKVEQKYIKGRLIPFFRSLEKILEQILITLLAATLSFFVIYLFMLQLATYGW